MKRSKYTPGYFRAFPLHYAAANCHVVEVQKQLSGGANPYQPTKEGLTPLHAAVANNSEAVVDVLLKQYEQDLAKIRDTIRHRFLWKVEQTGWKSRPILIAWSEAECQAALALASSCPAGIPLNAQVFVLLRQPQQGHNFIALDVCNRSKRLDALRTIQDLLPNGILSLDRSDMRVNVVNYLHMACSYSKKQIIVKLIGHGASLTVHSGEQNSTPFMAACEELRTDIVHLLATNYFDRFDPAACDRNDFNALHRMLQRQHTGMVELIVNHMLKYRISKHHETQSQAIDRIFRYDSEEYRYTSIWSFMRSSRIRDLCGKYVQMGQLDVRAEIDDTTYLSTFIMRDIALDYCYQQIEANMELLRLENTYNRMNVLHTLIRFKRLSFVRDLYKRDAKLVREVFETEYTGHKPAFELVRYLVQNQDEEGLLFVLEQHRDYYVKYMEHLQQCTLKQSCLKKVAYDRLCEIMTKTIPELKIVVTDAIDGSTPLKHEAFYDMLRSLKESFAKTVTRLEANGKRLAEYVDDDGRTFLHAAVSWCEKDLIEKLLAHGLDVMKTDAKGCLPIHLVRHSESTFEMLLAQERSAQLSYMNEEGYNLLHISCRNGLRGSALEILLEHGFDINGAAPDGHVPLSLASCCGTVYFLLEHGAKVELLNEDTFTRWQYCAMWELLPHIAHLEWFKRCAHLLLPWMVGNQNRDFFQCSNGHNLKKHDDIRRLLFDSLYNHSKEEAEELFSRVCHTATVSCARWFLEYDYNMDYNRRRDSSTPLIGLLSYMERPNFDVVEMLLRKKVDVNAVDDRKRTALIALASHYKWSKYYGHSVETFRLLLKHGAKLDEQDELGNTALHYAFKWEQWDLVEFLIESGANASLKNARSELACEMGPHFNRGLFAFLR